MDAGCLAADGAGGAYLDVVPVWVVEFLKRGYEYKDRSVEVEVDIGLERSYMAERLLYVVVVCYNLLQQIGHHPKRTT